MGKRGNWGALAGCRKGAGGCGRRKKRKAAGRLFTGEYPLRAYVYQPTVEKLPFRAGITLAAALAALLMETVCLILNGAGGQTGYILYFMCCRPRPCAVRRPSFVSRGR